jgi:hypothetical protein
LLAGLGTPCRGSAAAFVRAVGQAHDFRVMPENVPSGIARSFHAVHEQGDEPLAEVERRGAWLGSGSTRR